METLFVEKWNDINVRRLENYAVTMAEDGKTMDSAANKNISAKTNTKLQRAEQLYGGHLVRSGAVMAESNQTMTSELQS